MSTAAHGPAAAMSAVVLAFAAGLLLSGCSSAGANSTSCQEQVDSAQKAGELVSKSASDFSREAVQLATGRVTDLQLGALARSAQTYSTALEGASAAYTDLANATVDPYSKKAGAVASSAETASKNVNAVGVAAAGAALDASNSKYAELNSAAQTAITSATSLASKVQAATDSYNEVDGKVCR